MGKIMLIVLLASLSGCCTRSQICQDMSSEECYRFYDLACKTEHLVKTPVAKPAPVPCREHNAFLCDPK